MSMYLTIKKITFLNILCTTFFISSCEKMKTYTSHTPEFAQQKFTKPSVGVPHSKTEPAYVEVYGHRGARSYSPENTIPGFSTALKMGVNWIDLDIVYTKDRKIIAYHDLYLNPNIVKNSSGQFVTNKTPIYQLTYDELKQYDVGQINPNSEYGKYFPNQVAVPNTHIPLLSEVIDYINSSSKDVNFQLEIKTDPDHLDWAPTPEQFAQDLYKILKQYKIVDRVEIQAFDWPYLYALQKINPNLKTAYLVGYTEIDQMKNEDPKIAGKWTGGKLLKDYNNSLPQMVKALGGACFEPEDVILTKEQLEEAHKLGLKVAVWNWPEHVGSAFDPDLMSKLIEWNIDGIITDDPARLNSMLAARNYPISQNFPAGY